MVRPLQVDDVLRPRPTPGQLLWRGLRKHCPRCGGGHLYQGWFRMKERCPSCGYLFEREDGFFVGAYLINFAIVEGFLFVMLMFFVVWKDQHPDAGMRPAIILGLTIGLVGPILFYPFSRTIWSAFDLLMTPLEMDEIVAAADALAATEAGTETVPGAGAEGDASVPTAPDPAADDPADRQETDGSA